MQSKTCFAELQQHQSMPYHLQLILPFPYLKIVHVMWDSSLLSNGIQFVMNSYSSNKTGGPATPPPIRLD